jgi:hypothetical protein
MNKVKHTEVKKKPAAKKDVEARRFIKALNVIGLIDKQALIRFMPFIFFLTFLCIIYIANSYLSENTIRAIDKTEKELKELRSEYISGKSELMFRSKQTEVASSVELMGLKESTVAPKKIIVRKTKPTQ